ncbi:hypothetical protein ATANTOWER_019276 [Ataeniobius toweri]|uniref:DUF6729 domain-containing protein n=1 Tax=Ataeniobius toweri TaxID=208326 RepID=A0ABU7BHI9_9TELE|nr:hypothetical protein [Ataeniobius toweri]
MWQYSLKCPSCSNSLMSCGPYKAVYRVLDLHDWYYMGTECLECMFYRVAAWCRSVREQLELGHQLLFPALLRLSCNKKVLSQMNGPTLWSSALQLHSFLVEKRIGWLGACFTFRPAFSLIYQRLICLLLRSPLKCHFSQCLFQSQVGQCEHELPFDEQNVPVFFVAHPPHLTLC